MSDLKSMSDLEGRFYEALYRTGEADPEWNRRVLEFYVPFFSGCQRVLDVGCGRGEFLELLQERGISGVGIDIDAEMVRVCQEKGLQVVQADLFEYLAAQEQAFDGIFCSNVIEHMNTDQVLRFFQLAYQAVRPGGRMLVATPNPESLIVHLYEFWRDPTHVRLYNLPLLRFLMEYVGFQNVQGGENPETQWAISSTPDLEPLLHSISLFDIPDIPGDRNIIRRLIYKTRRALSRLLIRRIMFEEWMFLNTHVIELFKIMGVNKPREIYIYGLREK